MKERKCFHIARDLQKISDRLDDINELDYVDSTFRGEIIDAIRVIMGKMLWASLRIRELE